MLTANPPYRLVAAIALTCTLTAAALAGDARVVELVDGTQIRGAVVSYDSGVYTIQSEALGRLQLPDAKIRAIRSAPRQGALDHPGLGLDTRQPPAGRVTVFEERILSDPTILAMVMTLQQDPQVLTILGDPLVMQAILAGDLNALRSNPKILALEGNPTIQQLLELIARN
jgi:xanthine/CO dehydrogenase XdhC/CoxF family maturation factor